MLNGPLQGVRVIDLSTFVAVPSCARLLAEFGAEVIKIESFAGDPWRVTGKSITKTGDEENPIYDIYNIGKNNICLNIKNEKGLDCLMRMLGDADVFLTNIRPQSLKKLGLDAQNLTARFPHLIYASLNGYGSNGPEADKPGFDNVAFWSRSGFLRDMSLTENRYPVFGPTGIGDSVSGSALLSGVLAALYRREKTGMGDVVEASLYGSAIWFMASMIVSAQEKYAWKFPKSKGDINPMSTFYKCADGKWLFMVVLEYDRYASTVFRILGISEQVAAIGVTDNTSARSRSQEMMELMEPAFLKKTAAEWQKLFSEADIVIDEMKQFRDVIVSEQAWANEYLEKYICHNGEDCVLPCPPVRMGSYKRVASFSAAMPGENTDQVLREMGYSEGEILDMHNCKAVQ